MRSIKRALIRFFDWINSLVFTLIFFALAANLSTLLPPNFTQESNKYTFWLSISMGILHYIAKKSRKNRLRCTKCHHINYVWLRRPISKDETNRSDVYFKKVTEEVGFSTTESSGDIWTPTDDGKHVTSTYSGSSTSTHYAYVDRPHQIIEFREIYKCKGCKTTIGRRRSKEFQITENY